MPGIDSNHITGIVLAGGRGKRMDGCDKGLQKFYGQPLALHVLLRLQTQCARVLINANRNIESYKSFGVPVWPDDPRHYFAGPLAGVLVGLQHADTPYLLTAPCDSPRLPLDLGARLAHALTEQHSDLAMAAGPDTDALEPTHNRAQPVFCLLRTCLTESLLQYLAGGGHEIGAWIKLHRYAVAVFDQSTDDRLAFANVNTWDGLQKLEIQSTN